jgi:hypothetical protein
VYEWGQSEGVAELVGGDHQNGAAVPFATVPVSMMVLRVTMPSRPLSRNVRGRAPGRNR